MAKSTQDDFPLPYEPISDKRKAELKVIMRKGNRLLYQKYKIAYANGGPHSRTKFRILLFKKMDTQQTVTLFKVKFSKAELKFIQAVRDVEWEILCGYSRMVAKITHYWARREDDLTIDVHDLYSEGCIAMMSAVYCFGGKRTKNLPKFITYAHWAVYRRIMTVCMRSQPLTQRDNDLLRQFQEVKRNANKHITLDEAVEVMRLDEKQLHSLMCTLVTVFNQSSLQSLVMQDEQEGTNDYSVLGTLWHGPNDTKMTVRGRQNGFFPIPSSPADVLEPDMLEAVERTPMSDWERAVFEAYLTGTHGWQTQVAAEHVNPETKKPYSKRAPHIALRRVKQRIRDTYDTMRKAA